MRLNSTGTFVDLQRLSCIGRFDLVAIEYDIDTGAHSLIDVVEIVVPEVESTQLKTPRILSHTQMHQWPASTTSHPRLNLLTHVSVADSCC